MSSGIYKITNVINKKCYIGKSKNIEKRWQYHKNNMNSSREYNKPLYRAFRKYGIKNFLFEIIELINIDDYDKKSDQREQYWIKYYNSYASGYNATSGGDGGVTVENPRQVYGKLTEKEVIYLRQRYLECKYPSSYIYNVEFKEKITQRGFQAIWLGQNAKDIMPEVFTQNNKEKQIRLSRAYEGVLRRRVSLEQKKQIKQRLDNGENKKDIWRTDFSNIYKSYTGFKDMLEAVSLDEEVDLNGKTLDPISL